MRHLEAWHTRHEKSLDPIKSALHPLHAAVSEDETSEDMESCDSDGTDWGFDTDGEDTDHSGGSYAFEELASLMDFDIEMPEWFHLKEQSKATRQDKARQTRERNRKLREVIPPQDIKHSSPEMKRGRGRPPKAEVTKNESPKRGRGRPRKTEATNKEAPKRGRGRPPKPIGKSMKIAKRSSRASRRST
jgi:hypothetical protein